MGPEKELKAMYETNKTAETDDDGGIFFNGTDKGWSDNDDNDQEKNKGTKKAGDVKVGVEADGMQEGVMEDRASPPSEEWFDQNTRESSQKVSTSSYWKESGEHSGEGGGSLGVSSSVSKDLSSCLPTSQSFDLFDAASESSNNAWVPKKIQRPTAALRRDHQTGYM